MQSKPQSSEPSSDKTLNGEHHRETDAQQDADSTSSRAGVSPLDLARVIERVSRRFLDYMRLELTKLGVDDISPSQVMVLLTIGQGEIAVRDLLDRGHYIGSNASYNLKQLVESGYLERGASPRDRRLARISVSLKGQMLCERLRMVDDSSPFGQNLEFDAESDLKTTHDTLRRLEQWWSNSLRFGGVFLASCMSYSYIAPDLVNSLT